MPWGEGPTIPCAYDNRYAHADREAVTLEALRKPCKLTLLTVLNTFADSRRRGELAAARGYKVEPLPFDRSLNLWKPAR